MRSPEEIYERISAASRVEGIHENWSEYRAQVTAYLTEHTEQGSSLLICGAGRLGDYDLPALQNHFKTITLADVDSEAVREGLRYWGLSAKEETMEDSDYYFSGASADDAPLRLRTVNLTGITKEDYIEWIRLILEGYEKKLPEEVFAAQLEGFLHKVYAGIFHHDPGLGFCRFDYTACLGVHSQLNNTFAYLWMTLSDLLGAQDDSSDLPGAEGDFANLTERIFGVIRSNTAPIIERAGRALQDSAMEGCIVGLEVERIGVGGAVDGAAQAFAYYAAQHIEGEAELSAPLDLIWNYDPARNKAYRMRLITIL